MSSASSKLDKYVVPDMPSADQLLPYLRQIDSNQWYSNFGPLVSEFERRLESHLSELSPTASKNPISLTAVMTCYDALQIGLQLFRLPKNASVLVPAVTFPACPLAIQHAGAQPIFADVEDLSWQLTPATARRIAEKSKIDAVMPVAVYGVPVPTKDWDDFMVDTGIPVIIDAAAAFETQSVPEKCLLAHSFHATKPFSVGEGGILVSRNAVLIDEARSISNFGTRMRITTQDGCNAKMSEYHAAVGLAQLARWGEVKKHRIDTFGLYKTALDEAALPIALQKGVEKIVVSAFMLQSQDVPSEAVIQALNSKGVAAHRMYLPPLYHHPHFAALPVINAEGDKLEGRARDKKIAHMPISEKMYASVFGVPFHAFLRREDIDVVIKLLASVMPSRRSVRHTTAS